MGRKEGEVRRVDEYGDGVVASVELRLTPTIAQGADEDNRGCLQRPLGVAVREVGSMTNAMGVSNVPWGSLSILKTKRRRPQVQAHARATTTAARPVVRCLGGQKDALGHRGASESPSRRS